MATQSPGNHIALQLSLLRVPLSGFLLYDIGSLIYMKVWYLVAREDDRLLHLFGFCVLGLIFVSFGCMGPFCTFALLASLLFNLCSLDKD